MQINKILLDIQELIQEDWLLNLNIIKYHVINSIDIKPGDIFCIPLFMPKEDWKLRTKLKKEDSNRDFAFGRIIDTSSYIIVEIFYKIGPIPTDITSIISSGVMLSPLYIFADGIIKGRWNIIGSTPNYDKYADSNFGELQMVFGVPEQFRVRNLSTKEERPITRKEMEQKKIPFSIVWFPIDLENRIIKSLNDSI